MRLSRGGGAVTTAIYASCFLFLHLLHNAQAAPLLSTVSTEVEATPAAEEEGFESARTKWVAIMDNDGETIAQRYHRLLDFLDTHPKFRKSFDWNMETVIPMVVGRAQLEVPLKMMQLINNDVELRKRMAGAYREVHSFTAKRTPADVLAEVRHFAESGALVLVDQYARLVRAADAEFDRILADTIRTKTKDTICESPVVARLYIQIMSDDSTTMSAKYDSVDRLLRDRRECNAQHVSDVLASFVGLINATISETELAIDEVPQTNAQLKEDIKRGFREAYSFVPGSRATSDIFKELALKWHETGDPTIGEQGTKLINEAVRTVERIYHGEGSSKESQTRKR